MTPETFRVAVSEMHTQCCDLLNLKEKDYSDGKDRLLQFKQAAGLKGESPVDSLSGMMVKHTTKLYTMLSDTKNGNMFNEKQWEEILNDHSNYLFLLKAVLIEEGLI